MINKHGPKPNIKVNGKCHQWCFGILISWICIFHFFLVFLFESVVFDFMAFGNFPIKLIDTNINAQTYKYKNVLLCVLPVKWLPIRFVEIRYGRNVSNTKVRVEVTWNENWRKNPVQCGNNRKHQSKLPVTMVNSRLFAQKALFVALRKSRMRIDVMEVCSIIGCYPNWSLAKKKHVFFVSHFSRNFTHSNFRMCVCSWHILKFENATIDASNVSQWILVKINIFTWKTLRLRQNNVVVGL